MTTPKPVQLSRRKGARKPPGAIVVARPSRFGNPFTVGAAIELGYANDVASGRRAAVGAFEDWLRTGRRMWDSDEGERARAVILEGLPDLAGHDLACWCPLPAEGEPDVCHRSVLLRFANQVQQ